MRRLVAKNIRLKDNTIVPGYAPRFKNPQNLDDSIIEVTLDDFFQSMAKWLFEQTPVIISKTTPNLTPRERRRYSEDLLSLYLDSALVEKSQKDFIMRKYFQLVDSRQITYPIKDDTKVKIQQFMSTRHNIPREMTIENFVDFLYDFVNKKYDEESNAGRVREKTTDEDEYWKDDTYKNFCIKYVKEVLPSFLEDHDLTAQIMEMFEEIYE